MATQQIRIIYSAILAATLSACGGGGGDSGTAGISYTGATSQASVTVANGEEISTTAYSNGGAGHGLGTVLSSQTNIEAARQSSVPQSARLSKTLLSAINQVQLSNDLAVNSRAVQTVSDSVPGECGGSASFTLSVDDVTGSFSGIFSFFNYCDLESVINGSFTMTGSINLNSMAFNTINMTISSLTFSWGADSFTVDGSMAMNPDNNPIDITMDVRFKDNATQQVFWLEDFDLAVVETLSYEELVMVGKFYHPDHGYVNITTPTPYRFTAPYDYPYPGVMIAAGANGSIATLTSLSNTSYQIDIDEDGDGNSEQTTTGNWDGL